MKVFAYDCRPFDELGYFRRFAGEMGMGFACSEGDPTPETAALAEGCDAVSVITTPMGPDVIDALADAGVRMISTRTIGYDHIDLAHAEKRGMAVAHVTYDPAGVAEYTVMLLLMAVRKAKRIMQRGAVNDFTIEGLLGREVGNMTVGVVGAGRIGTPVLRDLSGFGCRLLYCDREDSPEADGYAEHVGADDLLEQCDAVSLHLELNEATRHYMGAERLASMKEGAVLVNTARGGLVDTDALISGLESGHLGGAALDVVEGEIGLYYNDLRAECTGNHRLDVLRSMPNVTVTHHMAFYYEEAVRDMVRNSLEGVRLFGSGEKDPFRLV